MKGVIVKNLYIRKALTIYGVPVRSIYTEALTMYGVQVK